MQAAILQRIPQSMSQEGPQRHWREASMQPGTLSMQPMQVLMLTLLPMVAPSPTAAAPASCPPTAATPMALDGSRDH